MNLLGIKGDQYEGFLGSSNLTATDGKYSK